MMAEITIINERCFWIGIVPDTPTIRDRLRKYGFEVANGVATKQYVRPASRTPRVLDLRSDVERAKHPLLKNKRTRGSG